MYIAVPQVQEGPATDFACLCHYLRLQVQRRFPIMRIPSALTCLSAFLMASMTACVDETSLAGEYSGKDKISEYDIVLNEDGTYVKQVTMTENDATLNRKKGDKLTIRGTWQADMTATSTCPESDRDEQCVTLNLIPNSSDPEEIFYCKKGLFSWECKAWDMEEIPATP